MAASADRHRVWAFIVYRESAPDGWAETLEETRIPAAISPLHDRDVWTERDEAKNPEHKAGTVKKPHWHVVLYYAGKKSAAQVLSDMSALGVKHVEPVADTRAYNRYLCHLDQDDKARYPIDEVVRLNGAACDMSRPLTADERDAMLSEMTSFVRSYNITEYADLVFYCQDERPEWFPLARSQTVYFKGLLASVRAVGSRKGGRRVEG